MKSKTKPVIKKVDFDGNETIYYTYRELPVEYSISGVSQCCKGKFKTYKGYKWEFVEASVLRECTQCGDFIHNGNKINLEKATDGKFFRCRPCNRVVGMDWHNNNFKEHYPKIRDFRNAKQREAYKVLKENKELHEKSLNKRRKSSKKYRATKKGKAKRASCEGKRRASKVNATPKWLSEFDLDYIDSIYIQAQELKILDGKTYHVDHIVPLKNKKVCGLHVPWNLQILEASENMSKNNRLIGENCGY